LPATDMAHKAGMEAIRLPCFCTPLSLSLELPCFCTSLSLSLLHAANMPGIEFDLNENPPESEVDQNIDWDSIAELEADVADGLQDFYPASVLKSFRFQISVGSLQVSVNCW